MTNWLDNKRKVSLEEARQMANRGVSLIWRPEPSLPEDQQYAVVMFDPQEDNNEEENK